MKISDAIKELSSFNKDATISVIVNNTAYENFTFTWGGKEGVTKEDADDVNFHVDELNNSENIKEE